MGHIGMPIGAKDSACAASMSAKSDHTMKSLHIERLFGYAPLQGEGLVYAFPWYFRARFDKWQFAVATKHEALRCDAIDVLLGLCPGFVLSKAYGRPCGYDAGVMEEDEAMQIIRECSEVFVATLFSVKVRMK
jgi:hypothetical protein